MNFECPNDGPFVADSEKRTTIPTRVDVVEDVKVAIPVGEAVERLVGICPECGSPIVGVE